MTRKGEKTGDVERLARETSAAATVIGKADEEVKNRALRRMADIISERSDAILAANELDLSSAADLTPALRERLKIDAGHIDAMAAGLREIAELEAVVGRVGDIVTRPSGIRIGRMRVPIGVVAIIYESRPNVTADAAGLCLKAGNAVILRGGSEAVHSNRAIAECLDAGLDAAGLPEAAVSLLANTDRAAVGALLKLSQYIDLVVPRGGRGLIERVLRESLIPVLKHLDGVCHVYIDADADSGKAHAIALNAKTHRYGVCNAMETLLVDKAVAPELLPDIGRSMREAGVEVRACERSLPMMDGAHPAVEDDWSTEYLAPILSVKVVDGVDGALKHIDRYGSHHTDAIVTENEETARRFLREVDSGSVMHNVSTRFADGYEYGLGAEIGISTDKLHARGPVGIEGLTSLKYVVYGTGQIRE